MSTENNVTKRHRRKKADLENDLFTAANKIISKYGFTGLTMSRLMKEAKAENAVFYNRYRDMSDFLDKFVRKYDYWLNDSLVFDPENQNAVENVKSVMAGLVDSLLENTSMQKLIAWELNESNFITRRTAQNRDNNSETLIKYFEDNLKNCKISFNISTAILLGGIYYLIIHRQLGTFNQVNYNTPEAIALLKEQLALIVDKVYDDYLEEDGNPNSPTVQIAQKLINNNVSREIIMDSTGLSGETLDKLYERSSNKG